MRTANTRQPRPEYPRPQFVREPWANLNGPWTYTFDPGRSGTERGLAHANGFDDEILVPFCPESALSGVGHTDFVEAMWYHRSLAVPPEWQGKRVLLHFGAVDYACEVFVDGQLVGRHWGGSSSFCFDVTHCAGPGEVHDLVVHVRDLVRSGVQPGGKQCPELRSHDCLYTRTTGIWQTVWMEAVDAHGLVSCHVVPDLDGDRFILTPVYRATRRGLRLRATLLEEGKAVAGTEVTASNGVPCELRVGEPRPWSPASPFLYGLLLEVIDEAGEALDAVHGYAGLRKVHVEGNRFLLNDEPFYLRLVLDQGFYPDGIWTAPSDDALRRDVELGLRAGFNGARLHQKVFEERFHYWADRLGYLTWGESASWGMDVKSAVGARNFLGEWGEVVARDRNHPSIVAWTPLNETHDVGDGQQHHRLHSDAYDLTRRLDPTRPVNDASGYAHVKTDLWTVHTYEQDPHKLRELLTPKEGQVFRNLPDVEPPYEGQPYLVDEFGGIKWVTDAGQQHADDAWGYGEDPQTLDEFYTRLAGLVEVIRGLEHVCGYCYTQLTDVEQEQNGIYHYDRTDKLDVERVARIFGSPRR